MFLSANIPSTGKQGENASSRPKPSRVGPVTVTRGGEILLSVDGKDILSQIVYSVGGVDKNFKLASKSKK